MDEEKLDVAIGAEHFNGLHVNSRWIWWIFLYLWCSSSCFKRLRLFFRSSLQRNEEHFSSDRLRIHRLRCVNLTSTSCQGQLKRSYRTNRTYNNMVFKKARAPCDAATTSPSENRKSCFSYKSIIFSMLIKLASVPRHLKIEASFEFGDVVKSEEERLHQVDHCIN